MEKRRISAKAILEDVREGLSDSELIVKHRLSEKSLKEVFRKLLDVKALSLAELNMREAIFRKRESPEPNSVELIDCPNGKPVEATLNEPPLIIAVRNCDLAEVTRLVELGADLEVRDLDGATPVLIVYWFSGKWTDASFS